MISESYVVSTEKKFLSNVAPHLVICSDKKPLTTNEQRLSILAIIDKQKLSTLSITNIKEQLNLIIANIYIII